MSLEQELTDKNRSLFEQRIESMCKGQKMVEELNAFYNTFPECNQMRLAKERLLESYLWFSYFFGFSADEMEENFKSKT